MITIAPTTERADIEAVCGVLHAAFASHDGRIDPPSGALKETPDSLAAKLAEETLIVAREGTAVVGCIFYRTVSDAEAYIGRLAVDPARQGRGIAGQLLAAALDRARERGAATVSLAVRVELTENIAFFERHGFVITRSESHPGYDRPTNYHMELRL